MKKRKLRHSEDTKKLNQQALQKFLHDLMQKHERTIKSIWILNPHEFEINDDFSLVILIDDLHAQRERGFLKRDAASLSAAIREEMRVQLHLAYYTLTEFWNKVMQNDLRLFVELCNAKLVYDPTSFVAPIIALADQGLIKGTEQSYKRLLNRIRERLGNVDMLKIKSLELLYKAATDSGQAPIIAQGLPIPVQKQVAASLGSHFVKKKTLEKMYQNYCEEIISTYKKHSHEKRTSIDPLKLEDLWFKTFVLVERMEELVENIEHKKKTNGP